MIVQPSSRASARMRPKRPCPPRKLIDQDFLQLDAKLYD